VAEFEKSLKIERRMAVENAIEFLESANVLHLPVRKSPRSPKPAKAKSMTIALSLKCIDGVVVAADRLFTHSDLSNPNLGVFGSYAKKVFGGEGDHYTALVAGSGSKDALYSLSGSLLTRFEQEETLQASALAVENGLEEELNRLSGKLGEIPNLSTLVAVSQQSHPALQVFRSEGLVIRAAEPTEVIGVGENSLVQFLLDTLYVPHMSVMQGVALAVLVIQQTKKYCPQYCGGVTDVGYLFYGVPHQYDLTEEEVGDIEDVFTEGIKTEALSVLINEAEKLIS